MSPRPRCANCHGVLASDSAAAGATLCSPCRRNDLIPLTPEELHADGHDPVEVLGLDPRAFWPCGHERTPENTYVELRYDRLDANGKPKERERCLICKNRAGRKAA